MPQKSMNVAAAAKEAVMEELALSTFWWVRVHIHGSGRSVRILKPTDPDIGPRVSLMFGNNEAVLWLYHDNPRHEPHRPTIADGHYKFDYADPNFITTIATMVKRHLEEIK